jgi:hypothetical protein
MAEQEATPGEELVSVKDAGLEYIFPATMSREEMEAKIAEYQIGTIPQDGPVKEPTEDYSWLTENQDLPMGVAGALAGERLGSPFGPPGRVAGAIVGGAVGTATGVLSSQYATDEELDYNKAVREGLIGMGIDVATLGAGKFIPNNYWVGTMKRLGIPADMTAAKIAAKVDTTGARQQTQEFLESKGLSLTPFQTGAAKASQVLSERIAGVGIFSGSRMGDHFEQVQEVIRKEFDDVYDVKAELGVTDVGSYLSGIIQAGKDGLSQYYDKTLTDINNKMSINYTSAAPLKAKIDNLFDKYGIYGQQINEETGELVTGMIDSELAPEARSFLMNELGKIRDVVAIDGKTIIQLEKKISQKQRMLTEANNFTAADDVMRLGEELKDTYAKLLSNIDPVQAERYGKLKDNYRTSINNLVPPLNKRTINRALRENDYRSLGNAVIQNGSVTQVSQFMSSIEQAYAIARKQGTLGDLPYKTSKEAKQQFRKSFLNTLFPSMMDKTQDLSKVIPTIRKYSYGDNEKKMKALFGPDYNNVKKLFNAIEHTAKSPSGDIGSLMFRNKEYSSLLNIASLVTAGAGSTAAGLSGTEALGVLGGAAFVLYTPLVMSKIVTDPKLANKLLLLTKGKFEDKKARLKVAGLLLNDVVKTMDDGEQLEFVDMLKAMHHEGTQTTTGKLPDSALFGM